MATSASPANTRDLLVKLCGMLGSDFEGERAAAALKITGLLREEKWRWDEILRVPGGPDMQREARAGPQSVADPGRGSGQHSAYRAGVLDWRADLACCCRYEAYLTDAERDYVAALAAIIDSGRACLRAADTVTLASIAKRVRRQVATGQAAAGRARREAA